MRGGKRLPDIDPFDEQVRQQIQRDYVAARKRLGVTSDDVARCLGVGDATAAQFEWATFNPSVERLYRYCAAVGTVPVFTIVGLTDIEDPPIVASLTAVGHHDQALVERLRARRLAMGVTLARAAANIGVRNQSISHIERNYKQLMLRTIQRYTRSLTADRSSHLTCQLEEMP